MIPTRSLALVACACAFMVAGGTGCAHAPTPSAARHGSLCAVSLPPLLLADGESIQSVEVNITDGRMATINRTWNDWNLELEWDSPRNLVVKCRAGHFVSGFSSIAEFNRFITVSVGSAAGDAAPSTSFDIAATVRTDSTDKTGRGGREYHFSRSEIVLSPRPSPAVWRKRTPFCRPSEAGVYFVQWGYSSAEIAEHLHLTLGQLSSLNPGVDFSRLKVGQVLLVSEPVRK